MAGSAHSIGSLESIRPRDAGTYGTYPSLSSFLFSGSDPSWLGEGSSESGVESPFLIARDFAFGFGFDFALELDLPDAPSPLFWGSLVRAIEL